MCVCVCVCARACARVFVCACVFLRECVRVVSAHERLWFCLVFLFFFSSLFFFFFFGVGGGECVCVCVCGGGLKHILNTDYIHTLHFRGIHLNGAEKIYRGVFQNN